MPAILALVCVRPSLASSGFSLIALASVPLALVPYRFLLGQPFLLINVLLALTFAGSLVAWLHLRRRSRPPPA